MKFCTFTKNRKHRQKTQICNINRQSDDSLIWKLSTPSDCHTQETRRKYKDCKLLQLLYPTQFTWGGKVKSCQQRLTLKAKRSKFLWATVWDLSPSIRQLSSSSTSSSHSFSCCLLFIFPPVHFFFLEPCWPEVRKNLGGCVGRSHVVKDSPQPHCPLELGLMKTNSDLFHKRNSQNNRKALSKHQVKNTIQVGNFWKTNPTHQKTPFVWLKNTWQQLTLTYKVERIVVFTKRECNTDRVVWNCVHIECTPQDNWRVRTVFACKEEKSLHFDRATTTQGKEAGAYLRRSSTKSIFVPIICMRARGSIKTFTPFSSTISSNLPRVSAAPNTACHSLVLFEYKQLLETGSGGGGGA